MTDYIESRDAEAPFTIQACSFDEDTREMYRGDPIACPTLGDVLRTSPSLDATCDFVETRDAKGRVVYFQGYGSREEFD